MMRKGKSQSNFKPHIQEQCGVWLSVKGRSKLQEGSHDQRTLPCYALTAPKRPSRVVLGEMPPLLPNPRIGGKQSTLNMFFKPTDKTCKDKDTVKRTPNKDGTQCEDETLTLMIESASKDGRELSNYETLKNQINDLTSKQNDFENETCFSSKQNTFPFVRSTKKSRIKVALSANDVASSADGGNLRHNYKVSRSKRKACFDEFPAKKQHQVSMKGDETKLSLDLIASAENYSLSENRISQTNFTDDIMTVSENLFCCEEKTEGLTGDLLQDTICTVDESSGFSATPRLTSELDYSSGISVSRYSKPEKPISENVCSEESEEDSFTASSSTLDCSLNLSILSPSIPGRKNRKFHEMISNKEHLSSLGLPINNTHSFSDTPVFDTLDDFTFKLT